MSFWERYQARLAGWAAGGRARLARAGWIVLAVARGLIDGDLLQRSASLAYTTLLSLVPLLAVSFSVLKAFGAHNALEPLLRDVLAPLGAQGIEVGDRILGFVENLRVGVLGSLGVALLFYTTVALIHKIELAFNAIWGVLTPRSPGRRFADYLSVILTGPVLAFTALGVSDTALHALDAFGGGRLAPLAEAGGVLRSLLPHLLLAAAFAFLYGFMPNTRVRPLDALAGGVAAGLLWYAGGRLFAALLADSGNYPAIYSGFAGAVLFILWLQIGWQIVLVGALVARHWSDPITAGPAQPPMPAEREALALALMTEIGRAFRSRQPPPSTAALSQTLAEPAERLAEVIALLHRAGLLHAIEDEGGWVPGRDLGTLELAAIVRAVRGELERGMPGAALAAELDAALGQALGRRTLLELVEAPPRLTAVARGDEVR